MRWIMRAVFSLVLCSFVVAVPPLWAFWGPDGVPLCTAFGTQEYPRAVPDGAGGAIVTWQDFRGSAYDVYAQRVDALGAIRWTIDGVAICTATGAQYGQRITSDGAGGAIVAWEDRRSGNWDVYAQRVDASGSVRWTANGVVLCSATGIQNFLAITSDGAGGAIVAWQDSRSGSYDIYAQRVNAAGVVQWTADGVALCTAATNQISPAIISAGAGGAIVAWQDSRALTFDIYAQRVDASGAPVWTADGVSLCAATGDQYYPAITSDGAGGAIVTWEDSRSGLYDIYAQRVDASGAPAWTIDGVALSIAWGDQRGPMITSDGAGGAICTWYDQRGGNWDIYAQRLNASGAVQWVSDGAALCTAANSQRVPAIIPDGTGGAIVTWYDYRSGSSYDIYAQLVSASGASAWTTDGVPLCTAAGNQYDPAIASDGAGGALVTWYDPRSGENDIYGQLVDRNGRVGVIAPDIHAVRDVPGDEGGSVYLSWYAARLDVLMDDQMSHYSIWRSISPAQAAMALDGGASALESLAGFGSSSGKPVIRIERAGALTYFWEHVETVEALYMEAYGKPVATLFDSTAACSEYHYFQVVAHTTDPKVFWKSDPDSGYSVDNLAPCPPVCLAGEQSFTPAGLNLTWNRNAEPDLDCYHVYRGLSADFVPGPGNILGTPCDTLHFDGSWHWSSGYYYKISAVDVHGNESCFALLGPEDVTGHETPKTPEASYLAQNYPNPFNPMTKIAFGLAAPAHVSIRIYDAAGRLVKELVNEMRSAARYEEVWDGRDGGGRQAASGIYFYRLDAGAFTQTKKMILLR